MNKTMNEAVDGHKDGCWVAGWTTELTLYGRNVSVLGKDSVPTAQ